jgi:hypothetical protein
MQIKVSLMLVGVFLLSRSVVGFASDQMVGSDKTAKLAVQMGGGCAVSIEDLYHGHFESGMPLHATYWTDKPPIATKLNDFSVNMVCEDTTGKSLDDIAENYGAAYDETAKKWHAYYVDEQDKTLLMPVTRIYEIKSINGSGFIRTTDDVIGDPDQRVRSLSYCVFDENRAVCGNGQAMKLSDSKGNLLPFVMNVLRTIEFQGFGKNSGD